MSKVPVPIDSVSLRRRFEDNFPLQALCLDVGSSQSLFEFLRRLKTVIRTDGHGFLDRISKLAGNFRVALAQRGQFDVIHGARQPVFGNYASQCGIEGGAERINIGARVSASCAILLGRRIPGCHGTCPGGGGLAAFDQFCQTKIHQVNMTIRCDANVAGFKVAVDNSRFAGVQILQGIAHGGADQDGLFLRDGSGALHTLAQVFPLDVIHDQILTLVADYEVIGNAWQVRMPQICQDNSFETELTGIFVTGEEVFLDRHIHAEILIHGAVNRSHAPLSKDFDNPVAFV